METLWFFKVVCSAPSRSCQDYVNRSASRVALFYWTYIGESLRSQAKQHLFFWKKNQAKQHMFFWKKKKEKKRTRRALMRTAPTTKLQICYHLRRTVTCWMGCCKRCARLTKALALASESLWFQGSDSSGSTRAWRKDQTCEATRRRARLNHLSQCLRHWLPARDNQAGPGDKPFSSLQSLRCTRHALGEPLHISILAVHNTPVWELWTARKK